MATNNQLNLGLSGSTGTGTFVGSAGALLTGSPTLNAYALGPVSAWVAYTPTFTGFGTVTTSSIFSRRVGGNLEIYGGFTAGTSTATEARMTLGINGSNSNITSSSSVISTIQVAGLCLLNLNGAAVNFCLIETSKGYITFSFQNSLNNALTKATGSSAFGTGTVVSIQCSIPCDTFP